MPYWERFTILAVVVGLAVLLARLVDSRIKRLQLDPAAETRYRVLRRSLMVAIVFTALLAGLMVIPQVRDVAGAILASGALVAIFIGFAAQRTIGNFVAGILIAFTQPLRIGDEVEVQGAKGIVEEIGLTYTWIRTRDYDRVAVPNEKLASDTIRNSTIRSPETLAEVTVQVPLAADLRAIVEQLKRKAADVYVTDLSGNATIAVRRPVADEREAERAASELRLEIHDVLRAAGAIA